MKVPAYTVFHSVGVLCGKSVNGIANKDIFLIGLSNSHAINGGNHSASLLISSSSSSSSSSATSPCRLTPEVGWNNQVDMSGREREYYKSCLDINLFAWLVTLCHY